MEMDDEKRRSEIKDVTVTSPVWSTRHDVRLWICGVLFIVGLGGAIFGIGAARGWNAQSGYTHNESANSQERFLPEPFQDEPGVIGRHGTDAAGRWYYWKLPPDRATAFTRLFVWVCYCAHQIFVWIVQYNLHTHKVKSGMTYTTSLRKWNYYYFGINVFFHLLHLLQTHTTYDATAQDVSIISSQCSVIVMLTFIVLMEYRNRGLFFGWPTMEHKDKVSCLLRLNYGPVYIVKRYHGYLCAWASIYTFWYHPMENTWGHVLGFTHTWIVLLQGSLMMTQFHLNRYWRLFLETWVLLHSGIVAFQTGGPKLMGTQLWPMFVFGFLSLFTLTTIFNLNFWKKIHFVFRLLPLTVVLAISIYMYSWLPSENEKAWVRLNEIVRIPAMYYIDVLLAWFLMFIFLKIEGKIVTKPGHVSHSLAAKTALLLCAFSAYGAFIAVSAMLVIYDIQWMLLMLTFLMLGVLTVLTTISFMFMRQVLHLPSVAEVSLLRTSPTNLETKKTQPVT